MSLAGWIGVDLDGTLARYDAWRGELHIGEPVPAMVERVKAWRAKGRVVKIFTGRVSYEPPSSPIVKAIEAWSRKHLGEVLPVTCEKDMGMSVLYDDRCVQVETNTGRLVAGAEAT